MYFIYSVIVGSNGEKNRVFAGCEEDEFMAKHRANVETCKAADYAYVKDSQGGTVFFIRRPDYQELPRQ